MADGFVYYIKRNGVNVVRHSLAEIKRVAAEEADRLGKDVTVYFDYVLPHGRGKGKAKSKVLFKNPVKKSNPDLPPVGHVSLSWGRDYNSPLVGRYSYQIMRHKGNDKWDTIKTQGNFKSAASAKAAGLRAAK